MTRGRGFTLYFCFALFCFVRGIIDVCSGLEQHSCSPHCSERHSPDVQEFVGGIIYERKTTNQRRGELAREK
jgi:hypothetical protein